MGSPPRASSVARWPKLVWYTIRYDTIRYDTYRYIRSISDVHIFPPQFMAYRYGQILQQTSSCHWVWGMEYGIRGRQSKYRTSEEELGSRHQAWLSPTQPRFLIEQTNPTIRTEPRTKWAINQSINPVMQ